MTQDTPGHRGKDGMYISPDADGALLVRMASGDGAAFDALYGRYVMVAVRFHAKCATLRCERVSYSARGAPLFRARCANPAESSRVRT